MADPVVICENDGDRLELGANPSSDTWLMLAWAGSYLVEDCAIGIPREALANLAMALLPHLTGDELRRVAEAMPRVAGAWKHRTRWGSRPLDGAPKDAADWAHYEDAHAARRFPSIRYARPGADTVDIVRAHFASAWDTIHGADAWAGNPWVWAVSFKRIVP